MPETITREAIEKAKRLFSQNGNDKQPSVTEGKLNVAPYLAHYYDRGFKTETKSGSTYFYIKCPFNPDHDNKDAAIIQSENGKLGAHCFHNSCNEKGWAEFRQAISGTDELTPFMEGYQSANKTETSNEPEAWEEPIPFDNYSSLPEFPVDALPSIGQEIVKAVSEVVQIDPGIPGNIYLPSLAVCLQKKAVVDLGTHQEPLNIYNVSVAESGERKSATVKILTDPLSLYQERCKEQLLPEINEKLTDLKIKEQRLQELQKRSAKADNETEREKEEQKARDLAKEIFENPVPKEPRFLADDITEEKLGALMCANNEKMGIFSAEGHLFCLMAGLYTDKTVNLNLFLKAHAGDHWSTDRISRDPLSMKTPCLTVCLAAQPDVIADIGQIKQFRGRGLLARFLFSWSKTKVGYRERQTKEIPEPLLERYRKHIMDLMDIPLPSEPNILKLSKDAQDIWNEFYNDIEREMRPGGSLEHLKDWGSKLPGAVARIAGLLHFAEYGVEAIKMPIPLSIVSSACAVGAYYKEHALATFGFMQADPGIEAAKLILDYIKRNQITNFKGRDVLANKNAFKKMDDVVPGLTMLLEHGYIQERNQTKKYSSKGGRREATSFEVNPKIFNS